MKGPNGRKGMRKIVAFEQVSLDGFFVDAGGDMSFAHKQDAEWAEFTSSNAAGDGALLFGRVTYSMMASFWPTPAAMERMPAVAEGMNRVQKIVFSRTLSAVSWHNTTLVKGDLVAETRRLKSEAGPDIVILGSGSVVAQLTEASLIDQFQIVVNPIILGQGRTLFEGVTSSKALKLVQSRTFRNGNVVLSYEPAA